MARGSEGESALHKHLRVLETFDSLRPFLTLTEIAHGSGLAISTAHRIVAELEREGLLERQPDRTYRLGVRLWEFASRTPGALGLREVAKPWMSAVHARIAQHTQLGVMSGLDVLFIERMSTRSAVVNATIIGGRLPLPLSSSGMVLLAYAGDDVRESVISEGWPRTTSKSWRDAQELRERLRHVRADGFAVMDGHIYRESRGIAVPVLGTNGVAHAALGVVVPVVDESPTATIELLTMAAAGIARALADAYLPVSRSDETEPGSSVGPLVSTSDATRAYFAGLGLHPHRPPRAHGIS